ncbi:MAG: hypothetical protein ABI831_17305 [Betaproteobacteria bacterium]
MHSPLLASIAIVSSIWLSHCAVAQADADHDALPDASPAVAAAHARSARQVLDQIILLYEAADLAGLRARLDPGFIGYQRFLEGVQRDFAAQRLVRIHLLEPRITAGPDVAAIQVSWEKRFVDAVRSEPQLRTGTMIVLLHRTSAGWQLAAIQGDDPFSTAGGRQSTSSDRPRAAGGSQ